MGNRNDKYRKDLSEIRPSVEAASERVLCFKFESERNKITDEDKMETFDVIDGTCSQLGRLLATKDYSIPQAEREGIRNIKVLIKMVRLRMSQQL